MSKHVLFFHWITDPRLKANERKGFRHQVLQQQPCNTLGHFWSFFVTFGIEDPPKERSRSGVPKVRAQRPRAQGPIRPADVIRPRTVRPRTLSAWWLLSPEAGRAQASSDPPVTGKTPGPTSSAPLSLRSTSTVGAHLLPTFVPVFDWGASRHTKVGEGRATCGRRRGKPLASWNLSGSTLLLPHLQSHTLPSGSRRRPGHVNV